MHTPAAVALTLAALGVLALVRLGAAFDAALASVAGALVVLRLLAVLAPAAALVSALALAMLTKHRRVPLRAVECALRSNCYVCEPWAGCCQWASKFAWALLVVACLTSVMCERLICAAAHFIFNREKRNFATQQSHIAWRSIETRQDTTSCRGLRTTHSTHQEVKIVYHACCKVRNAGQNVKRCGWWPAHGACQ